MPRFLKAKELIQEAKEKGYFKKAALYIGDTQDIEFIHFINADQDTLFDMASMTKIMVTTMVALKMVEEGTLCLFDTMGMFFDVPDDKKEITIQHLMTHTAGFEPFFDIQVEAKTKDKVVETILNRPLYSPVGENVYYSCIGYILLGKLLEKVGEASLSQLADQYVFEPLELRSSTYNPKGNNIAETEYSQRHGRRLKGIVHDENARFIECSGNAGLFSTIQDVASFGSMLAGKGIYKDKIYMSPNTLERAIHHYTEGMNEARGLGFSLYNYNVHPSGDLFSRGSFGHTGFTGTSLFVDKESGLYVVLLTNRVFYGREDTGFLRFRRLLHNMIVREYAEVSYETRN